MRHDPDDDLERVERQEVPRHVHGQAAPGEPRGVLDVHAGGPPRAVRVLLQELAQGGDRVREPFRRARDGLDPLGSHDEPVGLVTFEQVRVRSGHPQPDDVTGTSRVVAEADLDRLAGEAAQQVRRQHAVGDHLGARVDDDGRGLTDDEGRSLPDVTA